MCAPADRRMNKMFKIAIHVWMVWCKIHKRGNREDVCRCNMNPLCRVAQGHCSVLSIAPMFRSLLYVAFDLTMNVLATAGWCTQTCEHAATAERVHNQAKSNLCNTCRSSCFLRGFLSLCEVSYHCKECRRSSTNVVHCIWVRTYELSPILLSISSTTILDTDISANHIFYYWCTTYSNTSKQQAQDATPFCVICPSEFWSSCLLLIGESLSLWLAQLFLRSLPPLVSISVIL